MKAKYITSLCGCVCVNMFLCAHVCASAHCVCGGQSSSWGLYSTLLFRTWFLTEPGTPLSRPASQRVLGVDCAVSASHTTGLQTCTCDLFRLSRLTGLYKQNMRVQINFFWTNDHSYCSEGVSSLAWWPEAEWRSQCDWNHDLCLFSLT